MGVLGDAYESVKSKAKDIVGKGKATTETDGKSEVAKAKEKKKTYGWFDWSGESTREILTGMFGTAEEMTGGIAKDDIVLHSSLCYITGLPPKSDNVIDPPQEYTSEDCAFPVYSFVSNGNSIVGKDYLERVLVRGQYLVLIPLMISPRAFSFMQDKSSDATKGRTNYEDIAKGMDEKNKLQDNKDTKGYIGSKIEGILTKIEERLNINNYGLITTVGSTTYWKAVGTHLKAAQHALGLAPVESGKSGALKFPKYWDQCVPPHIVKMMNKAGYEAIITDLLSQKDIDKFSLISPTQDALAQENANNTTVTQAAANAQAQSRADVISNVDSVSAEASAGTPIVTDGVSQENGGALMGTTQTTGYDGGPLESVFGKENIDTQYASNYSIQHASARNILRYITNISVDENEDKLNQNMPFVTFYVDGAIERNFNYSTSLDESQTIKAMTDKVIQSLKQSAFSAFADSLTEMGYHDVGSAWFAQTYVPQLMQAASFDVSYSVQIRCVAAGSDPYSIFQTVAYSLVQLLPFVVERNTDNMFSLTKLFSNKTGFLVPKAPMYCAAFSKGVMNIPRGAISSLSIKTDPVFQTTEGIPTEITYNLTIQPLFKKSIMPDYHGIFGTSTDDDWKLLGDMFNPCSSFNLVVTLCGFNSVLTNVPVGLIELVIRGTWTGLVSRLSGALGQMSNRYKDKRRSLSFTKQGLLSL